jgi:hypothetical protein
MTQTMTQAVATRATLLHQTALVRVYDEPVAGVPTRHLMLGPEFRFRQGAMEIGRPQRLCLEYLQNLFAGAARARRMERALVLGVGAAAIPRALRGVWGEALEIDMVDLHAEILAVAVRHFQLPVQAGRMFVVDAARYVQATSGPYDHVCIDIWDDTGVPPWLIEPDFWQNLKRLCRPGATLAVNVPAAQHHALAQLLTTLFPCFLTWQGHNAAFCVPIGQTPQEAMVPPLSAGVAQRCAEHGADLDLIFGRGQMVMGMDCASGCLG